MKRLVFKKVALRRLATDNVTKQFNYVKYRAIHGGRAKNGWLCDFSKPAELEVKPTIPLDAAGNENKSTWEYVVNLDIGCRSKRARRDDVVAEELAHITKMVQTAGKGKGWDLVKVEDLEKTHEFSEDARNVVVPPKAEKRAPKDAELTEDEDDSPLATEETPVVDEVPVAV